MNKHLEAVIEYNWVDEWRDFEETFEVHIQSQDELPAWIECCEKQNNPERREAMTNHIFYHLMKLKLMK